MSEVGQIVVSDSGKVEIPESICEQLGLVPGTRLIVEADDQGGIRLRLKSEGEPPEQSDSDLTAPQLIWKNGVLMVRAEPAGDLEQAVERDREARLENLIRESE